LSRIGDTLVWGRQHDIGVGVSFIIAAIFGVMSDEPAERFTVVRLALSALQTVVGALLILRRPLEGRASNGELLLALPSLLGSGVVLFLAQPWSSWPLWAECLLLLGFALTAWSLLTLGRSFAVLPGVRKIVAHGPYRVVRHPAYASELIMVAAACFVLGHVLGILVFAAAILLVALRIRAEEGALRRVEAYRAYSERVRWRLFPLLW
jgi:protein-S-isoprenylcysteine O-methyltransferase Ste14